MYSALRSAEGIALQCFSFHLHSSALICTLSHSLSVKEEEEEEEEEEDGQIMSLGDSRIKRVRDRIAFLSMLTVRVVVLEYNQLHKKA